MEHLKFSNEILQTLPLIIVFAVVHLYGKKLDLIKVIPRRKWLSLAGGTSVAYVFLVLLPELVLIMEKYPGISRLIDSFTFLAAFFGLLTFYGLERLARKGALTDIGLKRLDETKKNKMVFWIHIVIFVIYNFIIGYLILHLPEKSIAALLAYGIALSFHLVVIDTGLRAEFGELYLGYGRYILSVALILGWVTGIFAFVSLFWVDLIMAFLAGGIILNVMKEELPAERESSYSSFLLGALFYGIFVYLFI
jgi:hypothetical protein